MHRIQELAALTVEQVAAGKNLTDALAAQLRRVPDLSPQERGAIQDITFGVMRHWAELKLILRQLVPNALALPFLEHLLVVAIYQLYYSRTAQYAVVNEAVSLAATQARGRFKGLVNGVLRNALRRRDELMQVVARDEEARSNHPGWWLRALQQHYPDHWQSIVEADNAHPPMILRVNTRRSDMTRYLADLSAAGIQAEALDEQAVLLAQPMPVRELPGFAEGVVSVQDWGAQQAARRLDLQPGLRVLDACAAPGGKTCHMLELADVEMTALDVDGMRLARVRENLDRLGLQAQLLTGDAGRSQDWWDGRPYDRILADVPCSASGVVRRHPDIRWLRRPDDFRNLARQQAQMLDVLWSLLASGGKMLYATCSIYPEENSQQLSAFLQRRDDAICLNQEQLLPTDRHDGFYYALLEKR
ncbi:MULTISPECIES: 16S rRNA (cytosine(967)-C(5))-methyltransferase RsmB [unclassified Paludibacterium]|uniref:16S rRNA (cytosine(967)-C(5))-methyltransferase RsmB n=1 Tax=unclassified Paludibacterium TaxID=2618429 RepID=UPI001C0435AE|nr:16S rRNA (cytosine(967)-C(5))-methyltransferase RsmB [Paludibacterium sp. B53371]BEV72428.1 16S rRNA (cytosine(967)-C(5))-methyltransferase RsmB [Paludibacterium sp. THUN1379]